MELNQVVIVHLQAHKVFKLLDAMVHLSGLVVFINDLENLTSFQITRVRFACGILSPPVTQLVTMFARRGVDVNYFLGEWSQIVAPPVPSKH